MCNCAATSYHGGGARADMSQHPVKLAAPPGARTVVVRGEDPAAVARAVCKVVGNGPVIAAGPFRYPYAAAVQLLREAGLFHDPTADTADDPMITREALCDLLWVLLRRGVLIGVACADRIDHSSAALLADFAAVARIAVSHGWCAGGLVLGTCGDLPACLQIAGAEIRACPARPAPSPALSREALRVLSVLHAAPHPVAESSLVQAADIGARAAVAAIRELASADLVHLGGRISLGPSAEETESPAAPWLDTPEVRLPLVRLALQPGREQACGLARTAIARDEHDIAFWCMTRVEPESASDVLLLARAAIGSGRLQIAHGIAESLASAELSAADTAEFAKLQALLVHSGLVSNEVARSWLRRAARVAPAVVVRPWRARLLAIADNPQAALNLLRRTTQAELDSVSTDARLQHELAVIRCLSLARDMEPAARRLRKIRPQCVTRAQRRECAALGMAVGDAGSELEFARICAAGFDAESLHDVGPTIVRAAIESLMVAR